MPRVCGEDGEALIVKMRALLIFSKNELFFVLFCATINTGEGGGNMEKYIVAGFFCLVAASLFYYEYSHACVGSRTLVETMFKMDMKSLVALSAGTGAGCCAYLAAGRLGR